MLKYIISFFVFFLVNAQLGFTGTLPEPKEVRINLVLRSIGHDVLLAQKDSTSKLEPIQTIQEGRYLIKIGKKVSYDSLVTIIDAALLMHGVEEKYDLALIECETNNLLLGFTSESKEADNAACQGRVIPGDCHDILIQFHPKKEASFLWIPIGLILLFSGLAYFYFRKNNNIEDPTSEPEWDESTHTLTFHEHKITFSHRENLVFKLLYESQGEVVSREEIETLVWENNGLFKSRTLDVSISKIRKKISVIPNWEIQAVHGIGYKLIIKNPG